MRPSSGGRDTHLLDLTEAGLALLMRGIFQGILDFIKPGEGGLGAPALARLGLT